MRDKVIVQLQTRHSLFLSYDDIPTIYREAVIATEDRSFVSNKGIDLNEPAAIIIFVFEIELKKLDILI